MSSFSAEIKRRRIQIKLHAWEVKLAGIEPARLGEIERGVGQPLSDEEIAVLKGLKLYPTPMPRM